MYAKPWLSYANYGSYNKKFKHYNNLRYLQHQREIKL